MEPGDIRDIALSTAMDLAKLRGTATVESLIEDARKIEEYLACDDLPEDDEQKSEAA